MIEKYLDEAVGGAHCNLPSNHRGRQPIVALPDADKLVGMDCRDGPGRRDEGLSGKVLKAVSLCSVKGYPRCDARGAVDMLAVFLAGPDARENVQLAERSLRMERGEPLPQLPHDLDDTLDLALVLRRRRAGWVSYDAVIVAQLGEGPVERRVINIHDDDAGFQVVEVDPCGTAAVVRERRDNCLSEGNLVLACHEQGEGQARIRQSRDESIDDVVLRTDGPQPHLGVVDLELGTWLDFDTNRRARADTAERALADEALETLVARRAVEAMTFLDNAPSRLRFHGLNARCPISCKKLPYLCFQRIENGPGGFFLGVRDRKCGKTRQRVCIPCSWRNFELFDLSCVGVDRLSIKPHVSSYRSIRFTQHQLGPDEPQLFRCHRSVPHLLPSVPMRIRRLDTPGDLAPYRDPTGPIS